MDTSPQVTILQPSANSREWSIKRDVFPLINIAELPKRCYVFLDVIDYPPVDGRRERLLAHFNVPEFVANRTCFELNGYFGNKTSYKDDEEKKYVTSCTTWFRWLVKMVQKVTYDPHEDGLEYTTGKKDYKWFEMTVFTRWDSPGSCQVLCVDTPPDFPMELQKLLHKQPKPVNFQDPFGMHTSLVDQMIVYSDISVWRVRDPVRQLEKSRPRANAVFNMMHEMSRHAIHLSEVLEAASDTLKEMQRCRAAIHERLREDLGETYKEQAKDYAQFQLSLLSCLKLRSDSNQERLHNERNLAFNNIARQDNTVMKSIALLTMIFLPATFISALFSTTFFTYGENGDWEVSGKMWIYWAITLPATIVIVVIWRIWIAESDEIMGFLEMCRKWVKVRWKEKARREKKTDP
ncbi:hypothetical protein MFIFM68171_00804 [Madurella fahalii]|uniref:Uncharacterized protein n=1 Tax=Madurella fahalii TaxID=1157608 RepID=A0ABQ0FYL5_9PEZI